MFEHPLYLDATRIIDPAAPASSTVPNDAASKANSLILRHDGVKLPLKWSAIEDLTYARSSWVLDGEQEQVATTNTTECTEPLRKESQETLVSVQEVSRELRDVELQHPHNCTPCRFHCFSLKHACEKGNDCGFCHLPHSSRRLEKKLVSIEIRNRKKGYKNV